MKLIETDFNQLYIVIPKIFEDKRGSFFESFNSGEFKKKTNLDVNFLQDNEASSTYGVLRGLHFQIPPFTQSKLVRVVEGAVLDVVVDLREASGTFAKCFSVILSEKNRKQLFVPRGFAHGYVVLSERAIVQYKCDNYYQPQAERGLLWNDPVLKINWTLPVEEIILSEKDLKNPLFQELDYKFKPNLNLYS